MTFESHYVRCKKCKPGFSRHSRVDAPKVLCSAGLKLYWKENPQTQEGRKV